MLPWILLTGMLFMAACTDDNEVISGLIKDGDGNAYSTIKIGHRTWFTENLKTTTFRDGTPITLILSAEEWADNESPAFSWFDNDEGNYPYYGALYNGYAVTDSRGLCPAGWHVATDADWMDLEIAMGMPNNEVDATGDRGIDQNVGGKLKATISWAAPNTGADNSSGFTALGTGYRRPPGEFVWFNQWAGFYTSSVVNNDELWIRYIGYDMQGIARERRSFNYAYSVRCVKDTGNNP